MRCRGDGAPLWFALLSGCCQMSGVGVGLVARDLIPDTAPPHLFSLVIIASHAAAAFLIASFLRLPRVWRWINLAAGPAVALLLALAIPSPLLLACLIVGVIIFLPTLWTRVPFYPTSTPAYTVLLKELPTDRPFVFVDLGCGFATLLSFLARRFPHGRFIGVELGPLPYLVARIQGLLAPHHNLTVRYEDLWRTDLSSADYVYAFLAPPPMAAIWEKVCRELPAHGTLIVNSFPVPASPARVISLNDARDGKLYFYSPVHAPG